MPPPQKITIIISVNLAKLLGRPESEAQRIWDWGTALAQPEVVLRWAWKKRIRLGSESDSVKTL